jgi:hypothetical protein
MSVTGEDIRNALNAWPFVPFCLHLADRRRVEVHHPEFALLSPQRRTLIFYATPNEGDWLMIDLGLVISMSPVERPGSSQAA